MPPSEPQQTQDLSEEMVLRDGTRLTAHVWLPQGEGPWPVVLQRFYQAGQFPFGRDQFVEAGYVAVHSSIRDADGNEGTRFTRDDLDGYDAVEWVAQQPWCNGQVALYGKSAGGITALAAASAQPPHLVAIVPMNSGDTWRWGYRANGAVTLAMAAGGRAIVDLREAPWDSNREAYEFLPLRDLDLHARGEANPLWRQIVENSEWNDFYRDTRLRIEDVAVPTLIMCGWWDYYSASAFRFWSTIRDGHPDVDVRVVIGATNHVSRFPDDGRSYPGGREDAAAEAVRWLDWVVKDESSGVAQEPPIKAFTMGENRWQRYAAWPPVASPTPYHLRRGGVLDPAPPGDEEPDRYTYDPDDPVPTLGGNHSIWYHHDIVPVGSFDHSAHEQRADVLVYSTPPLDRDTEVTGPVDLRLWAATDGPDTDWTTILLDVEPDGTPYNVTMGILRARYRRGIYRPPELLEPGSEEEYTIDLMPTSYTFRRGHRIRLYVSSSNFPLWDRNPNTGGPIHLETSTRPARQTICHDALRPSRLLLPVVGAS